MSLLEFSIQPLDTTIHPRDSFDCGVEALNRYLQEQAGQDMRRMASGCWVLVESVEPAKILGYYTLSPEGIEMSALTNLSASLRKKIPRYQRLGAVLLGRLAVHREHQGKGIGNRLMMDAFHRTLRSEIPSVLMVTDPKDLKAEAFYSRYGFERLNATRLYVPMVSVEKFLAEQDSHH